MVSKCLIFNYKRVWIPVKSLATYTNTQKHNIYPKKVTIVEVGPRDGLQNEAKFIPTATKLNLINKLVEAGVTSIETTSFVSPKWIPQLADHKELMTELLRKDNVNYVVLTPNLKGLNTAISCGAKVVAIFTAASESFTQKNTNCSIEESIIKAKEVAVKAMENGLKVRGYVSCVVGCPYEGQINPQKVAELVKILSEMQCYEISLGDTIGVGTASDITKMLEAALKVVPADRLAVHFHDTNGLALANIDIALRMGINVVDSSVAGLGGCPYAKGATGNVATEHVVQMLDKKGIYTGISLNKLLEVSQFISKELSKQPQTRMGQQISNEK